MIPDIPMNNNIYTTILQPADSWEDIIKWIKIT